MTIKRRTATAKAPVKARAPRALPAQVATQIPDPVPAQAAPETDKPKSRRRRASVGGHSQKLAAPSRPGFTRRWVNDTDNRIADAEELAYDHVTDRAIQSSSPDTRISRLVGTKANGEPLRAFLMETPDELHAEGVAEREAVHAQVDKTILTGGDITGGIDAKFAHPGRHGSIHVER